MGLVVWGEIKLKKPVYRIVMVVPVCCACVLFAASIGHELGDSFARNSISTVVADALHTLERREMEGLGKAERMKLIGVLSEQLPLALMDDRKAAELFNTLESDDRPPK